MITVKPFLPNFRPPGRPFPRFQSFLLRALEAFLPPEIAAGDDGKRLFRARVFAGFCLVMPLFVLPIGIFKGVTLGWVAPGTIHSGLVILLLVTSFSLFRFLQLEKQAFQLLVLGGLALYFFDLPDGAGGLSSAVIWAPIFVWAVSIYGDKSLALLLAGLILAFIFALPVSLPGAGWPVAGMSGGESPLEARIEIACAILAAAFLAFLFRAAKDRLEESFQRANAALAMAGGALERHQLVLKKILATIPHPICVKDRDGNVLKVNPALARLFDLAPAALEGMDALQMARGDREEAEVFFRTDRAVALGDATLDFTLRRCAPGQEPRFFHILKTPLLDWGAGNPGILEIWTDVTAPVTAEQAARILERMSAIVQVIGGVCHTVNNKNHLILGQLDAIRRGSPGQVSAAAQSIAQAVRAVTNVNDQLQTYARQRFVKTPETFEVGPVLSNLLQEWQKNQPGYPEIRGAFPPGLGRVAINKEDLEEVLRCLLANAGEATPGAAPIVVEASRVVREGCPVHPESPRPGRYVQISVSDKGPGMTPAVAKKAYEPFFTTKDPALHPGLGLSKVFGTIKDAGGGLEIQTKSGAGTSVHALIPLA